MSERLLQASGQPGMGPRMMRLSKGPWMIRAYKLQDFLMPGQFEGFGYRKIYVQEQGWLLYTSDAADARLGA